MTNKKSDRKKVFWLILVISISTALFSENAWANPTKETYFKLESSEIEPQSKDLQKQAFSILENKCNTCHRKKNPFMIFSKKNMTKRSDKINKQVFELKRMPKKEGVPLTEYEYNILKKWIESL